MPTNKTHILFACIIAYFCFTSVKAQEFDTIQKPDIPTVKSDLDKDRASSDLFPLDTLKINPDSLALKDSTKTDSLKKKESLLKYNIKQSADSLIRHDIKAQKTYLYDNAKIEYGDMKLEAGQIIMDNKNHEVYAFGIKDSTGNYTQSPVFTQGKEVIEPDSIRFNIETKRALVYNSRTEQGEFKVNAEVTKRVNDSVYYMRHVKFTTSKDLDDPEYYFYAQKVKLIPNKKVISGLVNMYIADIPTPLGLPFGYFPMSKKQHSGFIIPSIGNDRNRGYALQNGGYYFAISDYVDLTALGDYYSNGSYGLNIESNYALRYNFSGNFSLRYEKLLNSERGFPDFSESSIYNIRWSHQQDAKSNPSSQFSASVNLGSSKYYRQSYNESNSANFLNNNMSSSIAYSKTFSGDPEFRFSVTATHNQNTNTEEINMTLPTLQASISRIYPFAPKSGVKKGIIENINFQYDLRGENRYQTTDSLFFKPEMFSNANTGIRHSIPISTNFKVFDHFSINLGGTYQENWLLKTFRKSYDNDARKVIIDTVNNFDSYRTYNLSTSIGTTVYGMVKFGDKSKIQAIRHVMKPSLSYTYTPSFENFYDTYLIPSISGADPETVEYSKFENTLFGAPNKNYASNIGFSVTNDFEAKINKSDTVGAQPEKRKLLSNLRLGTSYNMAADSLKLQPVTFSGTIPIIKDKLDVNVNGALDPYALNSNNQRINKLNVNNGGSLVRLTRANMSFGYSFSNTDFEKGSKEDKDSNKESFRNGGRPDDLFGESLEPNSSLDDDDDDEPVQDDTERYRYKIPWDLRISYTMTYNNLQRQNEISSHSIMFSGNVEISPRWKLGVSSGYDLKNKGFTYTQFRFERDLKSWRMSFNWTPFGVRESWYFFIGIKANVLQAIKYDKRRRPDKSF